MEKKSEEKKKMKGVRKYDGSGKGRRLNRGRGGCKTLRRVRKRR